MTLINPRLTLRWFFFACISLALCLSCSSGGGKPTAPTPPPDNPTPPTLNFTTSLQPSGQALSFAPVGEDLLIEVVTVSFQRPGFGGQAVSTDFVPGLVHSGASLTVHVTTAWTWQDGDQFNVGVRGRRPGQTKTFPLCCLECGHDGGTLQNGPCFH